MPDGRPHRESGLAGAGHSEGKGKSGAGTEDSEYSRVRMRAWGGKEDSRRRGSVGTAVPCPCAAR